MNLLELFLKKLEENGFSKDDVRFLETQEILRKRIQPMTISEFSKKNGYNPGTISHMLNGRRAIPLSLIGWRSELSDLKLLVKNGNVAVRIPTKLTPKLAYLVGLLRDGTISKEKDDEYCCAFWNKNLDLLEKARLFVDELFETNSKISKFGDAYGVRIRSKTLYLFFRLVFEVPHKQTGWDTPSLIKQADNETKQWYIGGFFDAEGGVPHLEKDIKRTKKCLYVKFAQNNLESLEFIKEYLDSIGIQTRSVYRERDKWILKISNASIPKFADFVVSFHPQSANRLAEVSKLLS